MTEVLDVSLVAAVESSYPTASPPSLTAARLAAGLTITEPARVLHVARPTVSMGERGGRPVGRHYWPALGAALGPDTDRVGDLFAGSPPARLDAIRLPVGRSWGPADVPTAIRALRLAAGLTKVELGLALSRSGQAVAGWEAGRSRPSPATCRRLEFVFGLPRDAFPY